MDRLQDVRLAEGLGEAFALGAQLRVGHRAGDVAGEHQRHVDRLGGERVAGSEKQQGGARRGGPDLAHGIPSAARTDLGQPLLVGTGRRSDPREFRMRPLQGGRLTRTFSRRHEISLRR